MNIPHTVVGWLELIAFAAAIGFGWVLGQALARWLGSLLSR